jgi:DNA repair exonuclease SbcCD ATPase subunit
MRQLTKDIREHQDIYDGFIKQRERLREEKNDITRFMEYRSFGELNWWDEVSRKKELEEERKKLLSQSDELKELQRRLDAVEQTIKQLSRDIIHLSDFNGQLKNIIKSLEAEADEYAIVLDSYKNVNFDVQSFVPVLGD